MIGLRRQGCTSYKQPVSRDRPPSPPATAVPATPAVHGRPVQLAATGRQASRRREQCTAYALRAWLSASTATTPRTRRFARRSAVGSLLLGMAGQAGYHLLAQARITRAPWPITTAVSCLPVLVLGMGAALAHLLREDTRSAAAHGRSAADQADGPGRALQDHAGNVMHPELLARARAATGQLAATGQPVSRRALRAAGVRGSNASLGALARALSTGTAAPGMPRIIQLPRSP